MILDRYLVITQYVIILQPALILGSTIGIIAISTRRRGINARTNAIQKQVAKEQRKKEREQSQKRLTKRRALQNALSEEDQKRVTRENLVKVNELLKKVDHLLQNKEEEEALKVLIQVTALDKTHKKANEILASLYLKHDQNEKAELILNTLIEDHPHDPMYRSNLAHSFYNRRKFKAAIPHYEAALERDKANPVRYINIGHVYATKREFTPALEYYKKANRLSVRDVDLMFTIVETCLQNSDPITAREFLHKILDYEPYNNRAKETLSEVLDMLKEEA